jgi:molybdopterin molybdotransferase
MDMPPFDKSAVDGYACKRSDISKELLCVDTLAAGQVPARAVATGECMQIMTGCIIPHGADCVLMVEHTEKLRNGSIRYIYSDTATNICFRAEDIKAGQKVLESGTLLQPEHIAVLASVGCTRVPAYTKPGIGIISTGDELVEPHEKPGPAQIRNSNASQLKAQLQKAGFSSQYYGIAPDNPEETLEMIKISLNENQLTLLTGGVSMGEFDFVPAMMEKAGLSILFKSIAVQPGRPTLFGKTSTDKFCFGLPGNPVSSFVQLHLLVLPLLHLLSAHNYKPVTLRLPLAHDYYRKKTGRMGVIPAKIDEYGSISQISYHGSAHIHAYAYANAFMIVNEDVLELKKGELLDVRLI